MLLTVFLFACIGSLSAQAGKSRLYWVVETNPSCGKYSIVKFYDQSNTLIHEVKVDGIVIDVTKARQRKRLDQISKNYNERWVTSLTRKNEKQSI